MLAIGSEDETWLWCQDSGSDEWQCVLKLEAVSIGVKVERCDLAEVTTPHPGPLKP